MNTDQLLSIIRTGLKVLSGILIAHGLQNTADVLNSADFIGSLLLIAGCLWSHFTHTSAAPTDAGGNKVVLILAIGAAALFFTGCAKDLNQVAFKTEYAAAASSDAAMKGYAVYWKTAIQNPTNFNRTAQGLQTERKTLSDYSVKIGGAIELAENLRRAYATNSAVKPQLQSAVASLAINSAGIVATASSFLTSTNK